VPGRNLNLPARIADLKVISRTFGDAIQKRMPRNVREIGQQLGVRTWWKEVFSAPANRVRVNAQLVDARTDRHLWGQTYDRESGGRVRDSKRDRENDCWSVTGKLSPSEKNASNVPRRPTSARSDLYARAKNILLRTASIGKADRQQAVDLLNQATRARLIVFRCLLSARLRS